MSKFSQASSIKTINDLSYYFSDCKIKSYSHNALVLYNLVQYMSHGWSLCHVSETNKHTGGGKSIFVPSFLEKENQWFMVDILNE